MKKGKILGAALMSAVMGISMFATAAFGQQSASQESYRVLIQGPSAEKAKAKASYGARWEFEGQGFTTTVNAQQYQALLKNKNLKIERLPELQLGVSQDALAKPGGTVATAPSDQTPWGIQAIYNDSGIQATSGGDGIIVAVLDTGVKKDHKDLLNQVLQCKDFSQTKTPLVDGSCSDGNGHGTHVSGTVLANGGSDGKGIYGVAPGAKLWSYKVLNDRGSGYSDDIAAAIRAVADAASKSHVIISMSLGSSSKDSLISSAVDYAYGKGVLIVAAAGNDGPGDNTIGYPGALVNVVAVAALENVQQNGTYRVADFSSRGNPASDGDYVIQERDVEVSAPGRAVESTWKDGGYNTISGTSMATPHVSGLAAKIWAANPSWSHTQLRAELQNRAKANDILGGTGAAAGDDYASGFGFPRVR
ncbi:S8 family peptidase [Neobacillus bataviensis]|uniref:S8 family peptidase n=1 Tax=Neobacillus bataviensis TaxID=220685 RepID=UPI001CC190CC|nr:S8 family serine peptidase [Neobacillus bataviensis]